MKFSAKFKAMKAFKTFKILLIILLSIVLIVSLLKYFNLYTEGFSSNEELADYETKNDESCDISNVDSDSAVPACYATVQPHRGTDYLHHDDSDFILKTQIETPTCPNTPFEYGKGGFGSLITEDNHIETPDDSWLKQGNSNKNSTHPKNNTLTTSNSTPSTIESPYTIQSDIATNSPQNNTTDMKDMNLNFPLINMTPQPTKGTGDTTIKSEPTTVRDDKCPPCPACQRCPEPVVECKKVVNYTNAANAGQLPVPYINDFSKF
jgi:hypothetical protein